MNRFERNQPTDNTTQSAELEKAARRELALQGVDVVSEVIERDVTVAGLMEVTREESDSLKRLIAKRALRCIMTLASDDNPALLEAIGKDGLYDYAEGVITYGASDKRYLELMETFKLTPEEATGIYALRELIADQTGGIKPALQKIIDALSTVGLSVRQAALDPEAALAAFDEAGFITDHIGKIQYNRAIFLVPTPKGDASQRLVEDDTDGSITEGIIDEYKEGLRRPAEEQEDDTWRQSRGVKEYLKSLGF